jgi:hypothetical protein
VSADDASFSCGLQKLAAEISVAIARCHKVGQLSRAVYLTTARDDIYKAIHTPGRDERQLILSPDEIKHDV